MQPVCPECGRAIAPGDAVTQARRELYGKLGGQTARTTFFLHGTLWGSLLLFEIMVPWSFFPVIFLNRPVLGFSLGFGLIVAILAIGALGVLLAPVEMRRPLRHVWWLTALWITTPIYALYYRNIILESFFDSFIDNFFPFVHEPDLLDVPVFFLAGVVGWAVFPFAVQRHLRVCGIDAHECGVAKVRRIWMTIWIVTLIPFALFGIIEILVVLLRG